MEPYEVNHGGYAISTDPDRFDVDVFHRYLSEESYWAAGRQRSTTETALRTSMVFGVYAQDDPMVGAARIVTDWITFGWLCDLFVIDDHKGRGLGKALVAAVAAHPTLAALKRLILATGDAHSLYEGDMWMERNGPTR
jgi:GNAT superfamily N-acetyltransferase